MKAFGINKTVAVDTQTLIKQAGEEFAEISTDNREIIEPFNLFFVILFVFTWFVV